MPVYIRSTKGNLTIRRSEPTPMRLDDLASRLGPRLAPIRHALDAEADLAVVVADRVSDGDACVLIATRSAVHVSCLGSESGPRPATERTSWVSVRVSPMCLEPGGPSYRCEVLVGEARFIATTDATAPAGVEAFHDEVVRRGTPWHYGG